MCPSCKQPLSTIVKKRHKTLGVYVPVWGPGPCHNAECAGHVQESERDRLQEH